MKHQLTLLYHDVIPENPNSPGYESGFPGHHADIYKLSEIHFKTHLKAIAAHTSQIQILGKQQNQPGEPVFLAFDDGGSSALHPTADLLEARGWRGHFFIVTSRIGDPGFLNASEIKDLHRRGHLIGSHSHTHPMGFSRLTREQMQDEWGQSRKILSELLGVPVDVCSVPGGYYSTSVADSAAEAGYRFLFNSEPRTRVQKRGDLTILGRYSIQRETPTRIVSSLVRDSGGARFRQSLIWSTKKPLKAVGGKLWLRFRAWFFAARNAR